MHDRHCCNQTVNQIGDGNATGLNETLIGIACTLRNVVVIDRQISKPCYVFGNVLRLFRDCFFVAGITFGITCLIFCGWYFSVLL